MKRKIILATVLCLAVATLGIGAAPALAADGCSCHTDEPPSATAAHEPFVLGVDCTVCHADWTVPDHPAASTAVALRLSGRSSDAGYRLNGQLGLKLIHPGVVVYLQQRLWGASKWTDLTQRTTGSTGAFTYAVPSPTPWAAYRAIARGHVGPGLVGTRLYMPKTTTLRPKPTLTLKMSGPIPLGSIVASGRARPLKLAGEEVNFTVHKLKAGKWVKVSSGAAKITAKGTYWWMSGVFHGSFRTRAAISGTVNHRPVRTAWRYYKS